MKKLLKFSFFFLVFILFFIYINVFHTLYFRYIDRITEKTLIENLFFTINSSSKVNLFKKNYDSISYLNNPQSKFPNLNILKDICFIISSVNYGDNANSNHKCVSNISQIRFFYLSNHNNFCCNEFSLILSEILQNKYGIENKIIYLKSHSLNSFSIDGNDFIVDLTYSVLFNGKFFDKSPIKYLILLDDIKANTSTFKYTHRNKYIYQMLDYNERMRLFKSYK